MFRDVAHHVVGNGRADIRAGGSGRCFSGRGGLWCLGFTDNTPPVDISWETMKAKHVGKVADEEPTRPGVKSLTSVETLLHLNP